MAHTNHAHEEFHETAQIAARSGTFDRVDAATNEVRRGRDPQTVESSADPARAPARVQARRQRRPAPSFTVTIGEGLTDDAIVDAFAQLLVAVSQERPTVRPAPAGDCSHVIAGDKEPNHGNG
jgi:hypothetical protein